MQGAGRKLTLRELVTDRHASVAHFAPLFDYDHLPEDLRGISRRFHELVWNLVAALGDGPELSAALRKILEAKDCAVRQAVLDRKE